MPPILATATATAVSTPTAVSSITAVSTAPPTDSPRVVDSSSRDTPLPPPNPELGPDRKAKMRGYTKKRRQAEKPRLRDDREFCARRREQHRNAKRRYRLKLKQRRPSQPQCPPLPLPVLPPVLPSLPLPSPSPLPLPPPMPIPGRSWWQAVAPTLTWKKCIDIYAHSQAPRSRPRLRPHSRPKCPSQRGSRGRREWYSVAPSNKHHSLPILGPQPLLPSIPPSLQPSRPRPIIFLVPLYSHGPHGVWCCMAKETKAGQARQARRDSGDSDGNRYKGRD